MSDAAEIAMRREAWVRLHHVSLAIHDAWVSGTFMENAPGLMGSLHAALAYVWSVRPDLAPREPTEDFSEGRGVFVVYKPNGFYVIEDDVASPRGGPYQTRAQAADRALEIAAILDKEEDAR